MNFKKIFFLMLSISVSAPHIKTVKTPSPLQTLASKATIGAILTAMNKKKTWNKELKKISYLGLPLQELLIHDLRSSTHDFLPWEIEHTFKENSDNNFFSAHFSPGGQLMVTALADGTAKIWNAITFELIHTLKGHTNAVNSVRFSRDGKKIITTSSDNTAKIWDAITFELIHTLEGHTGWVNSADFSPDGKRAVTASADTTAKMWDTDSGKLIHTLEGHILSVNSAHFSPDGQQIVTASDDHTINIWNVLTGLPSLTVRDSWGIKSARFSPDGQRVVTGAWGSTAKLFDAATGAFSRLFKDHADVIISADFSPDEQQIITASADETVKLWDVATGMLVHTLQHADLVNSADFSPDGQRMVTASWDRTVKIWNKGIVAPDEIDAHQALLQLLLQAKLYRLKKRYSQLIPSRLSYLNPVWQAFSSEHQQRLEEEYQALNIAQAIKIPA